MEMEQEKMTMNKELSSDAAAYCCSACHGDETWSYNHPIRGRAKSRSLSASPALGSTKEFRYNQEGWFLFFSSSDFIIFFLKTITKNSPE